MCHTLVRRYRCLLHSAKSAASADQSGCFLSGRGGAQRRAQRSAPTLLDGRLLVHSGSNRSGHRAADLALWHSSVVQMSASPRVIRPRAWPDWSLRSARSTARCLSGVPGAGREPDATREGARARREGSHCAPTRDQNENKNLRNAPWALTTRGSLSSFPFSRK